MPLCPELMEPRCSCIAGGGASLCPVAWSFDPATRAAACASGVRSFGGHGKNTGDVCVGFSHFEDAERNQHVVRETDATLRCDVCYRPVPLVEGVDGASCRGFTDTGLPLKGQLSCR